MCDMFNMAGCSSGFVVTSGMLGTLMCVLVLLLLEKESNNSTGRGITRQRSGRSSRTSSTVSGQQRQQANNRR
jgi:hypothetical protein